MKNMFKKIKTIDFFLFVQIQIKTVFRTFKVSNFFSFSKLFSKKFQNKNFKTITIKKRKEKKIQNKIFPNFQFLFQKCKKKHKKFFKFFNLFVKFFEKFKEQLFILQFMKPADFFVFCEKKNK
jgi:hypothetical protein